MKSIKRLSVYRRVQYQTLNIVDDKRDIKGEYEESMFFRNKPDGTPLYFKTSYQALIASKLNKDDIFESYDYIKSTNLLYSNAFIGIIDCPCCNKKSLVYTKIKSRNDNHDSGEEVIHCLKLSDQRLLGEKELLISMVRDKSQVIEYICANCGETFDPKEFYGARQFIVTGRTEEFMIEKNLKGEDILRFIYTHKTKQLHDNKIENSQYILDINLNSKTATYFDPYAKKEIDVTFKSSILSGFLEHLSIIVNTELSFMADYQIPESLLEIVEQSILEDLKKKQPDNLNLKVEYFMNRIKSTTNSEDDRLDVRSLIKLVQQPLLPIETYRILSAVASSETSKRHNKGLDKIIKHCSSFLLADKYHTQSDFYKEFGINEKYYKKHIDNASSFILYLLARDYPRYTLDKLMENANRLDLGLKEYGVSRMNVIDFMTIDDIFTLKDDGVKLFYKYFKENGVKDSKIFKYLTNMVFKIEEEKSGNSFEDIVHEAMMTGMRGTRIANALNSLRDSLLIIKSTFDAIERKESENPIGLEATLQLPELTPFAKSFLHRVIATNSATAFHDKCLPMLIHLKIDNIEISYNNEFLAHTSESSSFKINGQSFTIVPATNTRDLIDCSEEMGICTVTYWKDAVDKNTNIFLVVNDNEKVGSGYKFEACIEVKNDYKVTQIKGRENKSIMPAMKPYIKKWAKDNNLYITTDDLSLDNKTYLPISSKDNPYKNYIERHLVADLRHAI